MEGLGVSGSGTRAGEFGGFQEQGQESLGGFRLRERYRILK